MTYVLCMKDKKRMNFVNGQVLLKWDQHDHISDYTQYAQAEIHICKICNNGVILFKEDKLNQKVYHKDLDQYRANWEIIDEKWSY